MILRNDTARPVKCTGVFLHRFHEFIADWIHQNTPFLELIQRKGHLPQTFVGGVLFQLCLISRDIHLGFFLFQRFRIKESDADLRFLGVYRFVSKVYGLFAKVDPAEKASADDLRAMHKCILEVTERIDQMKFNTAVSSMMTYVNYLSAKVKIAPELYSTLIKLLSPFTPHLAEEMWARLGNTTLVNAETWPQGDAKLAEDQVVTYAVQLCGKMRGTIEMPKDAGKEEIQAQAMALENVKRQIEGKEIVKVIVVPNRLINIVVKG